MVEVCLTDDVALRARRAPVTFWSVALGHPLLLPEPAAEPVFRRAGPSGSGRAQPAVPPEPRRCPVSVVLPQRSRLGEMPRGAPELYGDRDESLSPTSAPRQPALQGS